VILWRIRGARSASQAAISAKMAWRLENPALTDITSLSLLPLQDYSMWSLYSDDASPSEAGSQWKERLAWGHPSRDGIASGKRRIRLLRHLVSRRN
jgi:hypothetical protein